MGQKYSAFCRNGSFLCLPNSTLIPKPISISTAFYFFFNRSFPPLHTKERIKKEALCIWKMGNTYRVNGAVWCLTQTTTFSVARGISRGNKNKEKNGRRLYLAYNQSPFSWRNFAQLDIKYHKISFIKKKEASLIIFPLFFPLLQSFVCISAVQVFPNEKEIWILSGLIPCAIGQLPSRLIAFSWRAVNDFLRMRFYNGI